MSTQDTPGPPTIFPIELFDHILQHVCEDPAPPLGDQIDPEIVKKVQVNLGTCSLVCVHWANRCRPPLFRCCVVKSRDDVDALTASARRPPSRIVSIAQSVEEIRARWWWDHTPSWLHHLYPLLRLLGHRVQLRALSVSSRYEQANPKALQSEVVTASSIHLHVPRSLPACFTSFRELQITFTHFARFSDLETLVTSLPLLSALHLGYVTWSNWDQDLAEEPPAFAHHSSSAAGGPFEHSSWLQCYGSNHNAYALMRIIDRLGRARATSSKDDVSEKRSPLSVAERRNVHRLFRRLYLSPGQGMDPIDKEFNFRLEWQVSSLHTKKYWWCCVDNYYTKLMGEEPPPRNEFTLLLQSSLVEAHSHTAVIDAIVVDMTDSRNEFADRMTDDCWELLTSRALLGYFAGVKTVTFAWRSMQQLAPVVEARKLLIARLRNRGVAVHCLYNEANMDKVRGVENYNAVDPVTLENLGWQVVRDPSRGFDRALNVRLALEGLIKPSPDVAALCRMEQETM